MQFTAFVKLKANKIVVKFIAGQFQSKTLLILSLIGNSDMTKTKLHIGLIGKRCSPNGAIRGSQESASIEYLEAVRQIENPMSLSEKRNSIYA